MPLSSYHVKKNISSEVFQYELLEVQNVPMGGHITLWKFLVCSHVYRIPKGVLTP